MVTREPIWLLTGLLCLALLSGCASDAPGTGGAPDAYINKENPAPNSEASREAIRTCKSEIDPALLDAAKGGERIKDEYRGGGMAKYALGLLLVIPSMGYTSGPTLKEKTCNDNCRSARLEIPSQIRACMDANGGWIPCWGAPGNWVCQRKP
jgi:hypothetical protein